MARANQIAVMVPLDANCKFSVFSRRGGHIAVDGTAYVAGPAPFRNEHTARRP